MTVVVVIDTCVLRLALEHELADDKVRRIAYEFLMKLFKRKDIVVVFNSETIREYSRHISAVKDKIRRTSRTNPSFRLLRMLNKVRHKVSDLEFSFEFEGEPVSRKDLHLLNSAKAGALKFSEAEAYVITIAEDVYRGKTAKNDKNVKIHLLNMFSEEFYSFVMSL